MESTMELVDILSERRKDCDILWVARSMDPVVPHKLPPEAKYSRNQAINAVLNDYRVQLAIQALSTAESVDKFEIVKRARGMVNEMASKAELFTVRFIGLIITKVAKRIFSSIYIKQNLLLKLKNEMQISQVQYVYAPSHRSYMDFILMSYILFSHDMALPNIASAMDFYQMYIVGEMLRKTGAFYLRRSFANDFLYKKVFQAYVNSLVTHSDRAIEFFIEGTRSRSQKSIGPKYGLLSHVLESLLEGSVPDIQFIPISISYERPPEEMLFAYELLGVPKPKESTSGLFRSLSILQKPYAYGRVFFNIAEPISAGQFLTREHRKARILSPHAKVPSTVIEELAYSLIATHKKNTILTPFNLIALLFNERTQMSPGSPYSLDSLTEDYIWCNRLLRSTLNATVYTSTNRPVNTSNIGKNDARQEILDALKPHDELMIFDLLNTLQLKVRHKPTTVEQKKLVKGHTLSEQTMELAVSAINVSIYLNPVLSYLIKPAMALVAVGMDGTELGLVFERYWLLKTLLCTEFAMPFDMNKSAVKLECEETLDFLLNQNCLRMQSNTYVQGENKKLFSLLYNVILPFIDAAYVTCTVLFEWNEALLNYPTTEKILVESQKRVEEAFLRKNGWGQHPYSLSLDLFNSTLSNLELQGIIAPYGKRNTYQVDKVRMMHLVNQLESLSLKWPSGSYVDIALLPATLSSTVQAKL